MKNLKTRIISVLLILVILSSLVIPTCAASGTGVLVYSSTSNSGTRGDVCTTLDGTSAASYYSGYSYDRLVPCLKSCKLL